MGRLAGWCIQQAYRPGWPRSMACVELARSLHIIAPSCKTKGTRMTEELQIGLAIVGTLVVVGIVLYVLRYQKCGGDFAKLRQAEEIAQRYMTDAKFVEAV